MGKALAIVPELCSGCKICELVCAIGRFGINNPNKAAIRVLIAYPHPVMRLPFVCSQCKSPMCGDACPVGAISRTDNVVQLDDNSCISCMKCVDACPFGAIYVHSDVEHPIKCDLCGDGNPKCVAKCPKEAIRLIPESSLGEAKRLNNILSYTHMKEIEFTEKGEKKVIRYAEIGKEEL